MEKISWTDCVRNEEVLLRVKEERNILRRIKTRKASWIGYEPSLKHIIERNIEERSDGKTRKKTSAATGRR
jgi:hypothetical protein